MITLVATICLGMLCQEVVVPTGQMLAGKADAPIPMPFTMVACASGEGLRQALDWLDEEKKEGGQYANWVLKAPIKCVPGTYNLSKGA
jgi:hypothetical protein